MTTKSLRRWTILMLVLLAVLLTLDPVNAGGACVPDRTGTLGWICLP